MEVRLAQPSDKLPTHGLETLSLDLGWVWLAIHKDVVVGVLIASPMHGVIQLLRLVVVDGAPRTTALILTRRALKDARERGCKGLMIYFSARRKEEIAIGRLLERLGTVQFYPQQTIFAAGSLDSRFIH